jgi:hypothetical protein
VEGGGGGGGDVMDNTEHTGGVVNFYALILEVLGSNMLKAS